MDTIWICILLVSISGLSEVSPSSDCLAEVLRGCLRKITLTREEERMQTCSTTVANRIRWCQEDHVTSGCSDEVVESLIIQQQEIRQQLDNSCLDYPCSTTAPDQLLNTARTYLSQGTKDATWCRTALQKLHDVFASYMGNMQGCTEPSRSNFRSQMETLLPDINSNCRTFESCSSGPGTRYYGFLQALFGYEMQATISKIKLHFNTISFTQDPQLTAQCDWLRNMRFYMQANATNCGAVQRAMQKLHTTDPGLKMAMDTCALTVQSYEIPTSTGCTTTDVDTRKQKILNNCGFQSKYIDHYNQPADICPKMQAQIDCVLLEAGPCSSLVDLLLYPRLYTYGMTNTLLQCNISINDFWVKDKNNFCDEKFYGGLYGCYYQHGLAQNLLYGTIQENKNYGFEGLRRLVTLYSAVLTPTECSAFEKAAYATMDICVSKHVGCHFPFPTFLKQGSVTKEAEVHQMYVGLNSYYAAKYFNLGPTATGSYGPQALQFYSGFVCNQECTSRFNEFLLKFDEWHPNSCTGNWNNIVNGNCGALGVRMRCFTDVTQKCPAFIIAAAKYLNSSSAVTALNRCGLKPQYWPQTVYSASTNIMVGGFNTTSSNPLHTTSYQLATAVSTLTWFRTNAGGTSGGSIATTPRGSSGTQPSSSAIVIFISFFFMSFISRL